MSHGAQEAVLMSKFNPFQFVQEVRQEVSKVTWPTRKEVWITTIMVLIMVTLAAIFFLLTDLVIGQLVNTALGLRG
ncbi:preprotein translocase subunit SecE [Hyphomicrobium nitrativorans NL23]|uniref:Protein translocase subunit SecE n=2 Tax=Hyphomicrobiaceae TaxID=45401 RepID=V5SH06_9HYPH|nr:preprotein translocase subunit SecE [Hyphomicrobium nitrativorans NL23]